MEQITAKTNDSCISTTGTPLSPVYAETQDDVKYMNLNFGENSETSSQLKEAFLEYEKFSNAGEEHSNKPLPNKILPNSLSLNGVIENSRSEHVISLQEKTLAELGYKTNEVDGWEHIVQPSKEDLYKLLQNMIDNHIKPSVQICIGDVTFNCHMLVLQCYSEFFMECSNEMVIQLPEEKVTPTAFMMVYDWMLSSQPLVQRECILELFNAANFLRIKELINQCWLCLDDDVRFREDTAFMLYMEARNYGLENLEQLMLMRICKFFLTLVASKEFLTLNAKEICTILSSNTIGVNSEIEIFMSAVRWLNHDWSERECHMVDIIECVRFSLMPPWFLVTLNQNTNCIEIDRIIVHPEVKKLINDGITYTNFQIYYGENRQEFLNLIERFQLIAPMQRQWVYDKECKYHHRLECPNMQNISYRSFLEYLEMIRSIGKHYWRSLDMNKTSEKSRHCFLCTDCRKSNESQLATLVTKKSCDQGVQCRTGLKSPTIRDFNKTYFNHKNVGVKNSVRRTPRGRPRNARLPSASLANNCANNVITTEAEITTMDIQCNSESDIEQNVQKLTNYRNQQQQHERILCDERNRQQKRQQQTDAIEQGHIFDSHPLKHKFSNNITDNDETLKEQQERLEYQLQHHKTLSGSCTGVIYKRAGDLLVDDVTGDDCVGAQLQHRMQQQCIIADNHDDEWMKHNIDCLVVDRAVGDCKSINEELIQLREKQRTSAFVDDMTRISNYKVLVFGGIDPYSLHCQYVQQPQQQLQQQQQQHKTYQKELKQQQQQHYLPHQHHHYHHLHQQQELLQRKRVHSIDSIIMNTTTSHSYPLRCHQMQTHARAHTERYATNAVANKNLENFGDHVLYYDINAMEWRHLSHIPFGSRHHHAVVVCNGLIYVIGGTRTSMGCTKKSVFEKTIWCFNPQTVKWTLETNLPESRRDLAVIAIDNESKPCVGVGEHEIGFYVIGGEGVNGKALSTVWFYNTKRKLWLKKPSLNMGRYGLAAAMVNNEIWVAGGVINGNKSHGDGKNANATTAHVITDTIEIYNLKCTHCYDVLLANKRTKGFSNSKSVADGVAEGGHADGDGYGDDNDVCNTSRNCGSANILKNKPGHSHDNSNCTEGQWIKSKLHLRMPRVFGKFCRMANGQLYMVGGIIYNDHHKQLTSLTDVDVFNEKQQKWKHVGDLNLARHGHDVAIINDHCFVVIGGVSTIEHCTFNEVEVFCTKTGKCLENLPNFPWPVSGCAAVAMKSN